MELEAVLDGNGRDSPCFIPALPAMNRVTVASAHYIDGIPVDKSVFSRDSFAPVRMSYVPDLIHSQCDVPVQVVDIRQAGAF